MSAPRPPIGGAAPEPKLVRAATAEDKTRQTPLYCVWEITLACDLGCGHCGSRAGDARQTELDTQACLDVVAELKDLGIREVTLIGGEAYLRDDWHVIAAEITRLGMVCGMTTGARNLTAERVQQAVDAGIRGISISIDGLRQTHDAQRGAKGSYDAAVAAARRVGASPMRLSINTQINRLSAPELPALADLLIDVGAKAWQLQLTVPMGRGADRPDLPLQPYELLQVFPLLAWIKEQKIDPAGIAFFPGNNVGYFGPYEELLRYGGEKGAHFASCGAGKWTLGLEADGKIKGCPSLPSADYTGGYLGKTPLAEVVAHAPELTHIKERTRADLWGYCAECHYADVCLGGCTWTTQCLVGKPGNNPYCVHRALEREKLGLRERLVHAQAASGLPFDHGRFDLVLEDAPPAEATPSVLGVAIDRVLGLDHTADSLWDLSEISARLRPAGRLVQLV